MSEKQSVRAKSRRCGIVSIEMADPQQLEILRQGVEVWDRWRKENPELRPSLDEANLHKANLRRANLREANLDETDLSGAKLSGANLREAHLRGANLSGATSAGRTSAGRTSSWRTSAEADLSEADLRGQTSAGRTSSGRTSVGRTSAGRTSCGARLNKAVLLETIFGDTNLRDVQGLDTCMHQGPSIIDHRTLAKSGTCRSHSCGVAAFPTSSSKYLPSLLNEAIQFYSCFISYNHADKAFARRLYDTFRVVAFAAGSMKTISQATTFTSK